MTLPAWSQIDAAPDGHICTMVMQVAQGGDIQKAMDTCRAATRKITPTSIS